MANRTPTIYLPQPGLSGQSARDSLARHEQVPGNKHSDEDIIEIVSAAQGLMPNLQVFVTRLPDGHLRMWATIPGSLRLIEYS